MTEEEKKQMKEELGKYPAANPSDAPYPPGYEKKEPFQKIPYVLPPGELPVYQPSELGPMYREIQKTNPGEREVSKEQEEKALLEALVLQEQMEAACGKRKSGEYAYLVRGALLRCRCGSHGRRVNLSACHGAYLEEKPLLSNFDCLVGDEENIRSFGICSSAAYPARDPDWLQKGMKKVFGKKYDEEIMLLGEDGRNITGYPCIPRLLGTWMKPHTETVVSESEGMRAVTTQSFLVCAYGGWIFPETSGFEYEDPETEGIRPGYWRYPDE